MENQCKDRKLHDIFDQAFDMFYSFENRYDATNSNDFQVKNIYYMSNVTTSLHI